MLVDEARIDPNRRGLRRGIDVEICWIACRPASRIAVIRLRSLGDCVLTTPALALLKHIRPDLTVTVVVEPRFAAVFEGNPGRRRDQRRMSGPPIWSSISTAARAACVGPCARVALPGWIRASSIAFLYSHRIPRAQEILGIERRVHTAEHLASAMFWMGVPQSEIPRAKLFAEPAAGSRALRGDSSVCIRSPTRPGPRSRLSRSPGGCRVGTGVPGRTE